MKITILSSCLLLVACSDGTPPPQPTWSDGATQQQPQQSNHSTSDMLMGGFLGYMLGSSNRSAPQPQVIERQVERPVYIDRPAVRPPTPAVAKSSPSTPPPPAPPPPAAKPNFSPAPSTYAAKQNTPTTTAPPKPSPVFSSQARSSSTSSASRSSTSSGKR